MTLNFSKELYSPSFFTKSLFLGQIFFRKVLFDKKTYILIFISIFPLLPVITLRTATINSYISLISMSQNTNIFNFAVLPLICLILGISAIAEEKDNKTISQLLARPVKREDIVFVKWISVITIGVVIVCLDATIIYIGLGAIVQDFTILKFEVLLGTWFYLGMWVGVYCTIFLFLGIIIDKNALGWGLAIAYFEAFFGQFIFGIATEGEATPYSIANHINFIASEFFLKDYLEFSIPNFEPLYSLLICIVLIIGFLLLSMIAMRRKDFP